MSTAAAGTTIMDLHRALKVRMAAVAAANPLLDTKLDEPAVDTGMPIQRAAEILEYDVPERVAGEARFPFICVRPIEGVDPPDAGDARSTATFDLVVGTYSDTDDGGTDVVLFIDKIRENLGASPRLAGTAFEQTGPLNWSTENLGGVRPQWLGKVTTNWTLPRPRRTDGVSPVEE